ncbi:MAG: cadherin-like beta sandwich domain-containing protein, partial [Atopobiaceae bacterium]|nr:cadherin-like beta sandwich domain-containing protein [Atopobiaceae bacterium]
FIPDNVIIGGYFDLFLLTERQDVRFGTSEHAFFISDQTVFKGTARYDGTPLIPEAFVAIGLNGVTPTAAMAFAPDTANPAPQLASLSIGSLTLSPTFDAGTTSYTATTTGTSAKVTATAADAADSVTITVNGEAIANGGTATWNAGANTVAVAVQDNSGTGGVAVYTVTVTKS